MYEILQAKCVITLAQRGRLAKLPVALTAFSGDTIYIQGSCNKCKVLFETLCGLRKPEQGHVLVDGVNIYTLSAEESAVFRREIIGGVPFGGGLIPEIRMIDQIVLPLKLSGLDNENIFSKIRELTNDLLPFHSLFNPPSRVNERKQAHSAIIRALITSPSLIIMDGFLDDFDDIDADILWQVLKKLRPERSAFLYLSSNPEPEQVIWTKKLRI